MPLITESQINNPVILLNNDKEAGDAIRSVVSRNAFALNAITLTTTATLDHRYSLVRVDSSGGTYTVTLPLANYWGGAKSPMITFIHATGANSVTIAAAGSDTINGAATYTLATTERIHLVSDGSSKWYVFSSASAAGVFVAKAGDTMTGSLLFNADNSHDIGTQAATRPRSIYAGTSIYAGARIAIVGTVANANTFDAVNGTTSLLIGDGVGARGFTIWSGAASEGRINFADAATAPAAYAGYFKYDHSTNRVSIATDNGTERVFIDSTGFGVGIAPTNVLTAYSAASNGGLDLTSGVGRRY
jgi:hypothetical protein